MAASPRFEEWYLPTSDQAATLTVREAGEGPVVVWLHGGPGHDHEYLIDATAGLERKYRVVLYDQRGSLRSPAPVDSITFDAHVDDLERLRSELETNRIHLVAHAAGTLVAMAYLDRHPERTGVLTLIAPAPPATPRSPTEQGLARDWLQARSGYAGRPEVQEELRREGLDRPGLTAKQAARAWRIGLAGQNIHHVQRWRQLRGGWIHYSPAASEATARTVPGPYDFTGALEKHRFPMTVMVGADDASGTLARLARHHFGDLQTAELHVLRRAGHALWIDRPRTFRRLLGWALDPAMG